MITEKVDLVVVGASAWVRLLFIKLTNRNRLGGLVGLNHPPLITEPFSRTVPSVLSGTSTLQWRFNGCRATLARLAPAVTIWSKGKGSHSLFCRLVCFVISSNSEGAGSFNSRTDGADVDAVYCWGSKKMRETLICAVKVPAKFVSNFSSEPESSSRSNYIIGQLRTQLNLCLIDVCPL